MKKPKPVVVARMPGGTYQVLAKDCACGDGTHVGPHWLHLAAKARAASSHHLERIRWLFGMAEQPTLAGLPPMDQQWLARSLCSFVNEEFNRLLAYRRELVSRGIAEVVTGLEALQLKALHIDRDAIAYYRLGGGEKPRRKPGRPKV